MRTFATKSKARPAATPVRSPLLRPLAINNPADECEQEADRVDIVDADVEKLLQVRIRRISLFDINKHREEMEQTKAELEEVRKNLKGLTKYVIGHIEAKQ